MRALLVALLLAGGCSTTIEGGLRMCPEYTLEDMRELEQEFVTLWRLADLDRPELVAKAVRNADVLCNESVTVYGLGVVYGVTHSPGDVEIATVDPLNGKPLTLRQSALAHEWVHIALWNLTGDADASHAEGEGPWDHTHDAIIKVMSQPR